MIRSGLDYSPNPPLCERHLNQITVNYKMVGRREHDEQIKMALAEKPPPEPWFTYLIASEKYVKMGRARDVGRRLKQFNTSRGRKGVICPDDLADNERLMLLDCLKGDHEYYLHEKFASEHVAGEWFLRSRETEAALIVAARHRDQIRQESEMEKP